MEYRPSVSILSSLCSVAEANARKEAKKESEKVVKKREQEEKKWKDEVTEKVSSNNLIPFNANHSLCFNYSLASHPHLHQL